jgi:nucleoid DNA-binding protein
MSTSQDDSPPANGTQLASDLAKRYRLSQEVVHTLLGTAFNLIEEAVLAHGSFQFRGFGTFQRRDSAARNSAIAPGPEKRLPARCSLVFVHGRDRRAAFSAQGLMIVAGRVRASTRSQQVGEDSSCREGECITSTPEP